MSLLQMKAQEVDSAKCEKHPRGVCNHHNIDIKIWNAFLLSKKPNNIRHAAGSKNHILAKQTANTTRLRI